MLCVPAINIEEEKAIKIDWLNFTKQRSLKTKKQKTKTKKIGDSMPEIQVDYTCILHTYMYTHTRHCV